MAEHRTAAVMEALASVYDPCCQEKGLSVVDMGLVRKVDLDGDQARVELLLTTGWCPFAANLVGQITRAGRRPARDGRRDGRDRLGRAVDHRPAVRQGPAHAALPAPPQGGRPMIGDDAFVFDGVAHVFNFAKKNAFGTAGEMFTNHLYAFHATLTPDGEPHAGRGVPAPVDASTTSTRWSIDSSDTDMLVRDAAAADRPVPRRALALGGVRRAAPAATPTGRCSGARSTRSRAAGRST